MNWKKNTKAEYDTKTADCKEQEFVVWKHGKYHKVMEATVETNEDSCPIIYGFEREALYRTRAGKLWEKYQL